MSCRVEKNIFCKVGLHKKIIDSYNLTECYNYLVIIYNLRFFALKLWESAREYLKTNLLSNSI